MTQKRQVPVAKLEAESALDQVYQYIEEFKHLSERLEMVADNCKESHNRDSCRAIATLITTNAKIVEQKIKKYLSVIVHQRVQENTEEIIDKIINHEKYVDIPMDITEPPGWRPNSTLTKKN